MYSMFDLLAWAAKLVRLRPSWGGGKERASGRPLNGRRRIEAMDKAYFHRDIVEM